MPPRNPARKLFIFVSDDQRRDDFFNSAWQCLQRVAPAAMVSLQKGHFCVVLANDMAKIWGARVSEGN